MATAEPRGQQALLSINNYYYHRGGAETVFLEHNRMFGEAGWRVVPFAMQHPKNYETRWSDSFVSEIELGSSYSPWQTVAKAAQAVYSFEARRKIQDLIARVGPDICHAHNIYHHLSPSILPVIRQAQVPLVMTLHDLKLACPAYSMLSHDGICERCRGGRFYNVVAHRCMKGSLALSGLVMVETYLHRLLGSYVKNVDRFVVPSHFHRNKFVEWGYPAEKFTYIPNFVDAQHVQPEYLPGARFLYFGRLSREKGLTSLIRGAAQAGVPLDIAGRGPLEEELRHLVAEVGADVRFLGFLQGEDLSKAISGAWATVVPSECYENAPLSILEAYAHGKVVIGSSFGGIPELVIPDETGLIFSGGSVTALAEALARVAALTSSRLQAMGKRGRALVIEEFSPQRYVERMSELYASL